MTNFIEFSTHSGRSAYFRDDYFITGTRDATPFDLNPHGQLGDSAHDNETTVHGIQGLFAVSALKAI